MRLEDLTPGIKVRGIRSGESVTVLHVEWHGDDQVELTYKPQQDRPDEMILYRQDEDRLSIDEGAAAWSFDGDPHEFRLTAEALRIRNAHLFDPYMAVTTSLVEPLPHQITGVYGEMLPRQPLRFLLADDPGAGKTIMAGLFIRELLARGDLDHCLIVTPGALTDQWQDELYNKFNLEFDIITRTDFESAVRGNPFLRRRLAICRLDQLSRNDDLQRHLDDPDLDWDLVIVDEAHKMSAHYYGRELKKTKRYRLGERLGRNTRHFLLMTATPHSGKEEDFQAFLGLLDADRFAGKYRKTSHGSCDASDLMRRMVKEDLVWPDGRKLFPERRAYTVAYDLSPGEAHLYREVTEYVREEMNRADRVAQEEGTKKPRNVVGFALTTLQRRLASSPAAIHRSLTRRRKRLEKRAQQLRSLESGSLPQDDMVALLRDLGTELPEDLDELEELPEDELFELSNTMLDQATAARTVEELEVEIEKLKELEDLAEKVKASGVDSKWTQLASLLQDDDEMFDEDGGRRKLIIFTEHRDTLEHLASKLRMMLGRSEAVVTIRGGMGREARRHTQELFLQDKNVHILVATDAAGEGVNLQRAHLMINYDLPWNPNRLEQRFGRIHRILQTEVCHCWNLLARDTREGDVYIRLFNKLQAEREALDGKVFDVLGKALAETPLRDLLLEAIRYGDDPRVRARLEETIDMAGDRRRIQELLDRESLAHDVLDATKIREIREEMDRAQARRLQPHFIAAYFLEAFKRLGGRCYEREPRRYEVTRVPAALRTQQRTARVGGPVLSGYERVTFHKGRVSVPGKPTADFIAPGHPLLAAVIDDTLERMRDVLERGALLVDESDPDTEPRAMVCLEHSIRDGRHTAAGAPRVVSRRLQFVETDGGGHMRAAGPAPYLDYRPATPDERSAALKALEITDTIGDLDARSRSFAIQQLVPEHLDEVKVRVLAGVNRTERAVRERLTAEIAHWDRRAEELKAKESAGKRPRANWEQARRRARQLEQRLRDRLADLEKQRDLAPLPPRVLGGAVVIPAGLLRRLGEPAPPQHAADSAERRKVERLAVDAVIAAEKSLGRVPYEMPPNNPGYDIESRDPEDGRLVFIEVKGRVAGASTVTVTKTEILTALNQPDRWILALVEVDGDRAAEPRYLLRPFSTEPDFGTTSVNFDLDKLLQRAVSPGKMSRGSG